MSAYDGSLSFDTQLDTDGMEKGMSSLGKTVKGAMAGIGKAIGVLNEKSEEISIGGASGRGVSCKWDTTRKRLV